MNRDIKEIPLKDIHITGTFWNHYMETVRNSVIPYQWKALNDQVEGAEPSGCIHNFKIAAGQLDASFRGKVYQDSDLYKWLEAAAYSLAWYPDAKLENILDDTIELIEAAQQPDGYLNTYYITHPEEERFTNLMEHHELYCFGHLTEAAVAYYQATGKRKLLDVAIRFADCIDAHIGAEDGKKRGYPGHEEAELALLRLYKVTDNPKYLNMAKYMIDERGQEPSYFVKELNTYGHPFKWKDSPLGFQYYQAGKPVRIQPHAEGHSVRAVYLYSGMASLARETEDEELFQVCDRLWSSITNKRMYITGNIGSSHHGEAFTFDYDLPNDTIYGETCAAIGLVFFAKRMFQMTGDSRYADVMERALYNGTISGMSLDGTRFFYVNPLEVVPEACEKDYNKRHVKVERQRWFGCACCPPNLARLVASLGTYAYGTDDDTIYLNLYVGGELSFSQSGSVQVLDVHTDYPWDGTVSVKIRNTQAANYKIALRVPGWCEHYTVKLNDRMMDAHEYTIDKGYLYLEKTWSNDDEIQLCMDMQVKLISANPRVRTNVGKVAVMRGPVVYCMEEEDNGKELQKIYLEKNPAFHVAFDSQLLNGITVIKAEGKVLAEEPEQNALYYEYKEPVYQKKTITFVPYYSWSNRKPGEMTVWTRI